MPAVTPPVSLEETADNPAVLAGRTDYNADAWQVHWVPPRGLARGSEPAADSQRASGRSLLAA
jgi:hypothetical protein